MAGNLTAMIAAIFSGSAVSTDPYFNLTTLLLSTTATNGQQNNTFQDSSTNNFTITRNPATGPNAPTQGTFSPFSQTGWGNYFNGTNAYLSTPSITIGSGDFTIEGWQYILPDGTDYGRVVGIGDFQTSSGLGINFNPSTLKFEITTGNSTIITSSGTFSYNIWYHISLVRSGNTVTLYVNGTSQGSVVNTNSISGVVYISAINYLSTIYYGASYTSNVRITTTAIVPPAGGPTAPLTAVTGTLLLTCQSNRFIDTNTQAAAKTITVNGSPTVVPFSPFNPTSAWSASTVGGSGYLVYASANYLSTTVTVSDFYTALGDFTFEGWFYPLSFSGPQYSMPLFSFSNDDLMLRAMPTSATSTTLNIYGITSAGAPAFGTAGTNGGTIRLNEWAWVVFTRESGVLNLWVNGTRVVNSSAYTSNQLRQTATAIRIGSAFAGTNPYWNGYLSGVKWTSGAALYSGAIISMPTAPPTTTVSSGTNRLLLNFTNSGIYDATAKNVLETVGTAQASTTQAKFGTTSMYFDGVTTPADYLIPPLSPYTRIDAGDYTLEMWLRPGNVTTLQALLSFGSGSFRIFLNSQNPWFLNGASTIFQPATNTFPTANVWYHFAMVRKGSTGTNCAMWVNGTRISTGYANTVDFNTGTPQIAAESGGALYQGYMQDFRLTRFARYEPANSTITVPTAAFPVQ